MAAPPVVASLLVSDPSCAGYIYAFDSLPGIVAKKGKRSSELLQTEFDLHTRVLAAWGTAGGEVLQVVQLLGFYGRLALLEGAIGRTIVGMGDASEETAIFLMERLQAINPELWNIFFPGQPTSIAGIFLGEAEMSKEEKPALGWREAQKIGINVNALLRDLGRILAMLLFELEVTCCDVEVYATGDVLKPYLIDFSAVIPFESAVHAGYALTLSAPLFPAVNDSERYDVFSQSFLERAEGYGNRPVAEKVLEAYAMGEDAFY